MRRKYGVFRWLSALDPTSKNFLDFDIILPFARQKNFELRRCQDGDKTGRTNVAEVGFETLEEFVNCLKPLEIAFCERFKIDKEIRLYFMRVVRIIVNILINL